MVGPPILHHERSKIKVSKIHCCRSANVDAAKAVGGNELNSTTAAQRTSSLLNIILKQFFFATYSLTFVVVLD